MKQTIILKLYMATQQEEKRPESRRKSRRSLQDEACLMYAHTEVLVLDVTVSVSSFLPCLFHSEFFVLLVSSIPICLLQFFCLLFFPEILGLGIDSLLLNDCISSYLLPGQGSMMMICLDLCV